MSDLSLHDSVLELLGPQSAREVHLASAGVKTVSRIGAGEEELPGLAGLLEKHGLHFAMGGMKQIVQTDHGKGSWSSASGFETPIDTPVPGLVDIYVSRDKDSAWTAYLADRQSDHATLGQLLGFPACCISAYERRLPHASEIQGDFVIPLADDTPEDRPYPALLNVTAQYFGEGFISFYPCTFRCEEALATARLAFDAMRSLNASKAIHDLHCCSMPTLYTEYEGVYRFRSWKMTGANAFSYDPRQIEATLDGVLLSQLRNADSLHRLSCHRVQLARQSEVVAELNSPLLAMLLFDKGQP